MYFFSCGIFGGEYCSLSLSLFLSRLSLSVGWRTIQGTTCLLFLQHISDPRRKKSTHLLRWEWKCSFFRVFFFKLSCFIRTPIRAFFTVTHTHAETRSSMVRRKEKGLTKQTNKTKYKTYLGPGWPRARKRAPPIQLQTESLFAMDGVKQNQCFTYLYILYYIYITHY